MKLRKMLAGLALLTISACAVYTPKPIDLRRDTEEWANISRQLCGNQRSLTAQDMRRIGLMLNPDLNRARLTYARSTSVAQFAGLWADPQMSAGVERVLQAHVTNGSVSPGISLPVTGLPGIAKRIAEKYKEADYWKMRDKERVYMEALDVLHGKVMVTHTKLALMRERLREAEQEKAQIMKLYKLGEVSFADAQVLNLRVSEMLRDVQELENEHLIQHLALVEKMGLHPSLRHVEISEHLPNGVPSKPAIPGEEELLRHPALLAQLASYGAVEEELRREIRKQYPQLSLGGLYAHDGGNDKLGLQVGFNLPIWNRNREGIARSGGDRVLKMQETIQVWRGLVTQAASLSDRWRLVSQHCHTELERMTSLAAAAVHQKKLYDMGEIKLPELADARHEYYMRRMSYLNCLNNLLEIRTNIQYLNFNQQ